MHYHYINFEFHHADGFWARRQFVHSWGRIYAGDHGGLPRPRARSSRYWRRDTAPTWRAATLCSLT